MKVISVKKREEANFAGMWRDIKSHPFRLAAEFFLIIFIFAFLVFGLPVLIGGASR